jgi:hypothetical protein
MGHGGHHGGMSMGAMVADMRNRLLVAAALSVPILLYSPIGRNVLGFTPGAPFGLRDDVLSLVLSLPVISPAVRNHGRGHHLPRRPGAGHPDRDSDRAGTDRPGLKEILALAAAVERESEHPLARAVVAHADLLGARRSTATAFRIVPGRGAEAMVDGHHVLVGTPALLAQSGAQLGSLSVRRDELAVEGQTCVLVAVDGRAVAVIAAASSVVRATPDFFAHLGSQLGDERGPAGEPSTADFQAYQRLPIVEEIASGWDDLPELIPGRPEYRVLIKTRYLIPMISVVAAPRRRSTRRRLLHSRSRKRSDSAATSSVAGTTARQPELGTGCAWSSGGDSGGVRLSIAPTIEAPPEQCLRLADEPGGPTA